MPSKALTVKDAFNDLAKSTLDSLIETVVQLSKPAVSDEMVNVHLDARSVHSLEDSILIDQVVRTVLRTVDEKRFLWATLALPLQDRLDPVDLARPSRDAHRCNLYSSECTW